MQRIATASVLLPVVLLVVLGACQSSSSPPPEPWMPTGADAEVVSEEEAAAEAQATIRDDNADALYDELIAGDGGD